MNGYEFKYFNDKEESELYDYKILDTPDISYTESIDGIVTKMICSFN